MKNATTAKQTRAGSPVLAGAASTENATMKPLFKAGQKVKCATRKHGKFEAVVEGVEKVFAAVDQRGRFERGGLHTYENEINLIKLPHRFDGETLEVDFPAQNFAGGWSQAAHTMRSKFYGYDYSVRSGSQLYLVSESQLR